MISFPINGGGKLLPQRLDCLLLFSWLQDTLHLGADAHRLAAPVPPQGDLPVQQMPVHLTDDLLGGKALDREVGAAQNPQPFSAAGPGRHLDARLILGPPEGPHLAVIPAFFHLVGRADAAALQLRLAQVGDGVQADVMGLGCIRLVLPPVDPGAIVLAVIVGKPGWVRVLNPASGGLGKAEHRHPAQGNHHRRPRHHQKGGPLVAPGEDVADAGLHLFGRPGQAGGKGGNRNLTFHRSLLSVGPPPGWRGHRRRAGPGADR